MKPILFNTEMVRAILKGRKTVTRRVIKPVAIRMTYEDGDPARKPPYQPGDLLYVRETWAIHQCNDRLPPSIPCQKTAVGRDCYIYKADGASGKTPCGVHPSPHKWHPSIHMPKEAARLFLRVTNVRVERLQDITVAGLQEEGILPEGYIPQYAICTGNSFERFISLWNSTIKPTDLALYGWEANPWVWVIEFERVRKDEV